MRQCEKKNRNTVGLQLNSKKYFITTLSAFDEKRLKFSSFEAFYAKP